MSHASVTIGISFSTKVSELGALKALQGGFDGENSFKQSGARFLIRTAFGMIYQGLDSLHQFWRALLQAGHVLLPDELFLRAGEEVFKVVHVILRGFPGSMFG